MRKFLALALCLGLLVGVASAQVINYGSYRWTKKATGFDSLAIDTLKWTTTPIVNTWLPTAKYRELDLVLRVAHATLSPKYLIYVDYRYIFGPTSVDTVDQTYTITPGDDTLKTAVSYNLLVHSATQPIPASYIRVRIKSFRAAQTLNRSVYYWK